MQSSSRSSLLNLLQEKDRWFVLTGAGCSTETGIPDYRNADGEWKRKQPVQFREFMDSEHSRRRYWARSMVGWGAFSQASPGTTHRCLVELQQRGHVAALVTQNVDGLHQRAGSSQVVDLHGTLDQVSCMHCNAAISRAEMQARLEFANPHWHFDNAAIAPDGDVDLEGADYANFAVPGCSVCDGILKPNVVFFGESVPKPRVEYCYERLSNSDVLLVVGSSLMVFSGYRFVREAVKQSIPVVIISLGKTRGDDDAIIKVAEPCADVLVAACEFLGPPGPVSPAGAR